MTDWTLIITTLGAAGITGGVSGVTAYYAAKRNAEATAHQVEAETTRIREQIEAENERLREQHREGHLQNRQNTYHRFLNVEREIQSRFARDSDALMTREEYHDWAQRFFELFNGVLLFGPEALRPPMERLRALHGEVNETYTKDKSSRPFGEKMQEAYHSKVRVIVETRELCLDAMREDVAPG